MIAPATSPAPGEESFEAVLRRTGADLAHVGADRDESSDGEAWAAQAPEARTIPRAAGRLGSWFVPDTAGAPERTDERSGSQGDREPPRHSPTYERYDTLYFGDVPRHRGDSTAPHAREPEQRACDTRLQASAPPRARTRTEPPPVPRSCDPRDIARELGLATARSPAECAAARRRFARANHPDRVHPSLVANATERMMIANRLVDQAIRTFGRPQAPRRAATPGR